MKLGVVAALPHEIKPTLKALAFAPRTVEHLRCHESSSLVLAVGGIGARRAAAAALLVADTFKPDALLSVGFCGALTDDFETADLVVGGTTAHPARPELVALARDAAPKARAGEVLTVSKVLLSAEDKKASAKQTGAIVVDMEADAVAIAAASRKLGFLSVKVVIDTPSQPLASSYTGCWTVLKELLFRPGMIMQMMYDSNRAKLAADRLKDFFVALKEKLPDS